MTEMIHLSNRGQEYDFYIRPNTSDRQVIKEVIEQNAYRRKMFQVEAGETWLDLGANIGAFSLLALKQGASVKAYEPEPENADLLRKNLAFNHLSCEVMEQAVVADRESSPVLRLFLSTEYGKWGHSLYKPKRKKSILVQTVQFNTLLPGVDAIKMDIEGAEIPILSSVETMQNVRKLVFEWHVDMMDSVPFFLQTIDRLRQFFPNIIHRECKPNQLVFRGYPSGRIVFCWR